MRPWHAAFAFAIVAAIAGSAAGVAVVVSGDNDDPRQQIMPSDTIATMPPPGAPTQGPPYRVVIGQIARDELIHLVVGGLATDRPAPEPLRLWVGGDSTAVYMGAALANLAESAGGSVAGEKYTISSGLSRPDFFDWPTYLRAELERTSPNVVVLMLGANDAQGVVTPDGYAVSTRPLSPEWRAAYAARVATMMEIMTAPGRLVVWVGQPIMGPADYNERMRFVSDVYREQAAAHPGVVYFDSYSLFAGPGGQYQVSLVAGGGQVTVRTSDGIHFTTAGGALLAAAIFDTILANSELQIG